MTDSLFCMLESGKPADYPGDLEADKAVSFHKQGISALLPVLCPVALGCFHVN